MRRRTFVGLVGGVVAMPALAFAQDRVRRVGVLMNVQAGDPEAQSHIASFQQGMQELGWTIGSNIRFDVRWASGDFQRYRQAAAELIALSPDVVLVAGAGVTAVQRASGTVPIVFPQAVDPVGAGFVVGLARPGGNTTGFMQFEYSLVGKWFDLLKEVAPGITRVGMLREPANPAGIGQWAALQVAVDPAGIEVSSLSIRNAAEVRRDIDAFAQEPNGCLVVGVGAGGVVNRQTIIEGAARHRLPAIYPYRYMATEGGLMAYGVDLTAQYRRAASYVDRILKGEKPANLPVQRPIKYTLTVNLKTAKAMALTVPPSLLARADEVIE